MNRVFRFPGFFLVAALILSPVIFHGCDATDSESGNPEGEWESKFIRIHPETGFPDNIRVMLILDAKKKSAFSSYWNGFFSFGFAGGWSYQGDSLYLTATECYKGDSTGTQFINDCDEDLPSRVMSMFWDGAAISYGEDADRIKFHRKAI